MYIIPYVKCTNNLQIIRVTNMQKTTSEVNCLFKKGMKTKLELHRRTFCDRNRILSIKLELIYFTEGRIACVY